MNTDKHRSNGNGQKCLIIRANPCQSVSYFWN